MVCGLSLGRKGGWEKVRRRRSRWSDTQTWHSSTQYARGGSGSGTGDEAVVRHGARRGPKVRCSETQTHIGNLVY